ncbi:unnamed protein product [Coffea canephora]|uniref:Uncharacterized protein n=1 Tax=Coffea canephora TaxID=49390 RepID=A0A068UJR5_COFCA|nr:unnamed protein product [Coffea canephora]
MSLHLRFHFHFHFHFHFNSATTFPKLHSLSTCNPPPYLAFYYRHAPSRFTSTYLIFFLHFYVSFCLIY